MYIINILDINTNKTFKKEFNNEYFMRKFVKKCKYSKKLKIISIIDNSKFYD